MKKLCALLAALMFAAGSVLAGDDFSLLIFNHQIAIGMTYKHVQSAWGKPRKVDRSTYRGGVIEYWFFGKDAVVVFDNGKVTSFHE